MFIKIIFIVSLIFLFNRISHAQFSSNIFAIDGEVYSYNVDQLATGSNVSFLLLPQNDYAYIQPKLFEIISGNNQIPMLSIDSDYNGNFLEVCAGIDSSSMLIVFLLSQDIGLTQISSVQLNSDCLYYDLLVTQFSSDTYGIVVEQWCNGNQGSFEIYSLNVTSGLDYLLSYSLDSQNTAIGSTLENLEYQGNKYIFRGLIQSSNILEKDNTVFELYFYNSPLSISLNLTTTSSTFGNYYLNVTTFDLYKSTITFIGNTTVFFIENFNISNIFYLQNSSFTNITMVRSILHETLMPYAPFPDVMACDGSNFYRCSDVGNNYMYCNLYHKLLPGYTAIYFDASDSFLMAKVQNGTDWGIVLIQNPYYYNGPSSVSNVFFIDSGPNWNDLNPNSQIFYNRYQDNFISMYDEGYIWRQIQDPLFIIDPVDITATETNEAILLVENLDGFAGFVPLSFTLISKEDQNDLFPLENNFAVSGFSSTSVSFTVDYFYGGMFLDYSSEIAETTTTVTDELETYVTYGYEDILMFTPEGEEINWDTEEIIRAQYNTYNNLFIQFDDYSLYLFYQCPIISSNPCQASWDLQLDSTLLNLEVSEETEEGFFTYDNNSDVHVFDLQQGYVTDSINLGGCDYMNILSYYMHRLTPIVAIICVQTDQNQIILNFLGNLTYYINAETLNDPDFYLPTKAASFDPTDYDEALMAIKTQDYLYLIDMSPIAFIFAQYRQASNIQQLLNTTTLEILSKINSSCIEDNLSNVDFGSHYCLVACPTLDSIEVYIIMNQKFYLNMNFTTLNNIEIEINQEVHSTSIGSASVISVQFNNQQALMHMSPFDHFIYFFKYLTPINFVGFTLEFVPLQDKQVVLTYDNEGKPYIFITYYHQAVTITRNSSDTNSTTADFDMFLIDIDIENFLETETDEASISLVLRNEFTDISILENSLNMDNYIITPLEESRPFNGTNIMIEPDYIFEGHVESYIFDGPLDYIASLPFEYDMSVGKLTEEYQIVIPYPEGEYYFMIGSAPYTENHNYLSVFDSLNEEFLYHYNFKIAEINYDEVYCSDFENFADFSIISCTIEQHLLENEIFQYSEAMFCRFDYGQAIFGESNGFDCIGTELDGVSYVRAIGNNQAILLKSASTFGSYDSIIQIWNYTNTLNAKFDGQPLYEFKVQDFNSTGKLNVTDLQVLNDVNDTYLIFMYKKFGVYIFNYNMTSIEIKLNSTLNTTSLLYNATPPWFQSDFIMERSISVVPLTQLPLSFKVLLLQTFEDHFGLEVTLSDETKTFFYKIDNVFIAYSENNCIFKGHYIYNNDYLIIHYLTTSKNMVAMYRRGTSITEHYLMSGTLVSYFMYNRYVYRTPCYFEKNGYSMSCFYLYKGMGDVADSYRLQIGIELFIPSDPDPNEIVSLNITAYNNMNFKTATLEVPPYKPRHKTLMEWMYFSIGSAVLFVVVVGMILIVKCCQKSPKKDELITKE